MLPLRFLYDLWLDARLFEIDSARTDQFKAALVFTTILVILHVAWAIIRDGKIRHFLWPAPILLIRWLLNPDSCQLHPPWKYKLSPTPVLRCLKIGTRDIFAVSEIRRHFQIAALLGL